MLAVACLAVFLNGQSPGETENKQLEKAKLLSLSGTYRIRGEFQDGFNIRTYGTGTHEDYLLSRLRLEFDLRLAVNFRIHAQIQDAEALGLSFSDEDFLGGNNPYHDPFDINQLYLEWWPIKKVGLKIGRQAISYGDRRVFGPGDWGNTGRYAWDAVRLDEAKDAWYFPGKAVRKDPTGSSGRPLGHEVDLTVRKKISGRLELLSGICVFLPGEYVKKTGRSPAAKWCFLETTFYF